MFKMLIVFLVLVLAASVGAVGDVNGRLTPFLSVGEALFPQLFVFGSDLTLNGELLPLGTKIEARWKDTLSSTGIIVSGDENHDSLLKFLPVCALCDDCRYPYSCPDVGDTVIFYVNGRKTTSYPLVIFGLGDPIEDSLQHEFPDMFVRLRSFSTCCNVGGDVDNSGSFNMADLTYIVSALWLGGPDPTCFEAGDMNGDGAFNVADVVSCVTALWLGGSQPVCK